MTGRSKRFDADPNTVQKDKDEDQTEKNGSINVRKNTPQRKINLRSRKAIQ